MGALVDMRPVFICDWDGTLISDHNYPEQGDWLPGAVDALHELLKHGRVKISTLRLNPYEVGHDGDENYRRSWEDIQDQKQSIEYMLDEKGLHAVEIHTTNGKPAGTWYIDNQAIEFDGSWEKVLDRALPGRRSDKCFCQHDTMIPSGAHHEGCPEYERVSEPGDKRPSPNSGGGAASATPGSLTRVRTFDTGATRDTDQGKLAYEGFFSPLVLEERARYMHRHRVQSDGELRAADNWQKGMPLDAYIDSGFRHFVDWWQNHRCYPSRESLKDAICALMFNCEGYLHELLKQEVDKAA